MIGFMDVFYSDRFVLPLPEGHRFPMEKYRMLRERVAREFPQIRLYEPDPVSDEMLRRAHDAGYIARMVSGDLSRKEIVALGFPWSMAMVERSRRSVGATVMACRRALHDRVSVNLAGGTHHAHADRAEGYCCFNDAVVAIRALQNDGRVQRVAVIDLDVHQGNGTASITQSDPSIFTLSMHGATNFPFRKERSSLDVELADGATDDEYLERLDWALAEMASRFTPDFVMYLAGADPYEDDRLGRLALTKAGLYARDLRVFSFAQRHSLPVAVTMAGGYARDISDTVEIQLATVSCALQYWRDSRGRDT